MKNFKSIFFLFCAVLMLLPSAVSFAHIFSGHEHTLCNNYSEFHYHKDSLDCELHKFHKNPALQIKFEEFSLAEFPEENEQIFDFYKFLNEFEGLHFDLRGPPSIA